MAAWFKKLLLFIYLFIILSSDTYLPSVDPPIIGTVRNWRPKCASVLSSQYSESWSANEGKWHRNNFDSCRQGFRPRFATLVIDDVEPYGECSVASLSSSTTMATISVIDSLPIDIDHPAVKEYLSLVRFVGLVFTGVIWDTTDNRRRKDYRSWLRFPSW